MVEVSAEVLCRDAVFMNAVDVSWNARKKRIKSRVQFEKRKFKTTLNDQYVDAMRNYNMYVDEKDANRWDNAMYLAHLYIELALDKRLHRPSNPKYRRFGDEVYEVLKRMQEEMEYVLRGLKLQIIELFRLQIEKELREGKDHSELLSLGVWHFLRGDKQALVVGTSVDSTTQLSAPATGAQTFSPDQVRDAMNALRIDSRKTDVSLYGMIVDDTLNDKVVKAETSNEIIPPPTTAPAKPFYASGVVDTVKEETVRKLDENFFRVKRVVGDGNCAFRSIAQGIHDGKLSYKEESLKAANLRTTVTQELQRCADEEMTGTGLTVEQIVLMKDTKFSTYSEYVKAMSRSEYAGETEFWLLSRRIGMQIAIYMQSSRYYENLITYGKSTNKVINLLWQKGLTENGNHYDCLLSY